MTPQVFIERSRFGKVFFELRGELLSISGTRALEKFATKVELHALTPRTERLSRRFYRPILLLGLPGIVMLAMTAALALPTNVPSGALIHFSSWTGIFGAIFFGTTLKWVPRVEVVRFKDVVGRVAFDIVKERKDTDEFEEFVQLLEQTIVQSKLPDNSPETNAPPGQ